MKLEKIFIVTETLNLLYEAYDDEMSRVHRFMSCINASKKAVYTSTNNNPFCTSAIFILSGSRSCWFWSLSSIKRFDEESPVWINRRGEQFCNASSEENC